MIYSSYAEQVQSHIHFLQNHGLDARTLEFGKFTRCHGIGESQGRGKYAYICNVNRMGNENFLGLVTWCRGKSGTVGSFKTYGLATDNPDIVSNLPQLREDSHDITEAHKIAARKAYGFWKNLSPYGQSDYLIRKQVGSYGVHFHSSAAVVPMRDEHGYLWSCQFLNPDGTKRMTRGTRTKGLFHKLSTLVNGSPIGIAESYVTAATCFELSGIPTVCCFSANNMPPVTLSIRKLHPKSPLVLFADNDRHLELQGKSNKGLLAALESIKSAGEGVYITPPDFGDLLASKEASDWNDLVRLNGFELAKAQMQEKQAIMRVASLKLADRN